MTLDLLENGPRSRSRIADSTGLTRGSVTALSAALVEAGVVRESEPLLDGGKGRPVTHLLLAADDVAFVALQLDADRAEGVAVTLSGDVLARRTQHHGRPMGRPELILDVLAAVATQVLADVEEAGRRVIDLSVVVFAPVGGDPVVVLADTDLQWGRVDVLRGLRDRVPGLPASMRLQPDATLAALAELRLRPGILDLVYLKSNSGIGGAAFVDGRLVAGSHEAAGAFGHLPVDFAGDLCDCGQRGCLVTVAGPDVVLERAGLRPLMLDSGLTLALEELVSRIAAGESDAVRAWHDAAVWIGRALQIIVRSFDPAVVVFGGYWAELVDTLRPAFLRDQPTLVGADTWAVAVLEAGVLGQDAALRGALWSARAAVLEEPLLLDPAR
ncbi:ROK family protein [Frondihabitans sucicola]|uniref:ROK family protein n=1 Tax=Frondihabitans sucicola TaxID=1268041 RepID=UPI002573E237|nr:ROK family protein [Frondihabitans sucicola]